MCWLLAGCCGLALIHISVALLVTQKPRFYGVKAGRKVCIYCLSSEKLLPAKVQWFKAQEHSDRNKSKIMEKPEKIYFSDSNLKQKAFLFINDVRPEDSAVYFCKIDGKWGPGTAVEVSRPIKAPQALYRSQVKDGLMVLQGLLLAACIAALLLRKRQLVEKKDSIYEEPEIDHIYEGLAVETCGGGLYEELSAYDQPDAAEAPWE